MAKISYQYNSHNGGNRKRRHRHHGVTAAVIAGILTIIVGGVFWGYEIYQNNKALERTNIHVASKSANNGVPHIAEPVVAAKQINNVPGKNKPASAAKPKTIAPVIPAVPAANNNSTGDVVLPDVVQIKEPVIVIPAAQLPTPVKASAPPLGDDSALLQITEAENALKENLPVKSAQIVDALLEPGKLTEFSPIWNRAIEILNTANTKIILSDVPYPGKKVNYIASDNDVLEKIALANNTTIELIQQSNNLKGTDCSVWSGRAFRIYKGSWKIKVSKQHLRLLLYDSGKLFKVYHVGIGREDRTPAGNFTITSKVKEPAWYSSTGKVVPYGSPGNVIGTRWLKLSPEGVTDKGLLGYGIHGTWDPDSIGKTVSNGCVRMKNQDVEELFMIVPRLTPVTIAQ
jgi:hypothetical protein